MEANLTRFLEEIGAWEEVDRSIGEYLKIIEEKGTDFADSSIVVPLKYEYSMFTEDFRRPKKEIEFPTLCETFNIFRFPESLLQFLILDPLYYEHMLRSVILEFMNTKLESKALPFRVELEQIHFVYRFAKLPLMEKYKFYPKILKSLSNFTCIVAGRGELQMYT